MGVDEHSSVEEHPFSGTFALQGPGMGLEGCWGVDAHNFSATASSEV